VRGGWVLLVLLEKPCEANAGFVRLFPNVLLPGYQLIRCGPFEQLHRNDFRVNSGIRFVTSEVGGTGWLR